MWKIHPASTQDPTFPDGTAKHIKRRTSCAPCEPILTLPAFQGCGWSNLPSPRTQMDEDTHYIQPSRPQEKNNLCGCRRTVIPQGRTVVRQGSYLNSWTSRSPCKEIRNSRGIDKSTQYRERMAWEPNVAAARELH